MPSLLDPGVAEATRARVAQLEADTPRRWGKMDAARMLCHLTDAFRVALGEQEVPAKWTPFRFYPLRWLFAYTLPWPKGRLPTMKEFLSTKPAAEFARDVEAWNAALDRFLARARSAEPLSPHPAMGRLSNQEWAKLSWFHHDHHLRQFGV